MVSAGFKLFSNLFQADFRLVLSWFETGFRGFQTGFRVVSDRFQTRFKLVSNWFQTGFIKQVSDWFQMVSDWF